MAVELEFNISKEKQMEVLSEVASPLVVISELVKNAFDENAKNICISIDTKRRTIELTDDGRGFTEQSIVSLSSPGESYKKKRNLLNPHGKFYSGSMGIGLLSVFSICKNFRIITKGSDGEFLINGDYVRLSYEKISNDVDENGTKILLNDVNERDIKVLVEDINEDKLKHISVKNYLEDYNLFNLSVVIDGVTKNIETPYIEELYKLESVNFTSKVDFSYNKKKKELLYKIERNDSTIINSKQIAIKFDREIDIEKILEENYHIINTRKKEDFIFLPHGANQVCDFQGTFYIKEGNKGYKEVEKFGAAVRLYVNGFAMYNYIDRENDWLKLSYLSQNVQNSGIKPNNTIGYISFDRFNEYEEELQISKERSHFYDKSPYRAFYEMLYNIVVLLTFNIDVATRNKKNWSTYFDKDYLIDFNKKLNDSNDNKTNINSKKVNKDEDVLNEKKQLNNNNTQQHRTNESEKTQTQTQTQTNPNIILKSMYTEPVNLNIGTYFDPEQYVTAFDSNGEILKCTPIYEEDFNINKIGEYQIKYVTTDKNNNTSHLVVSFKVVDPNKNTNKKPRKGKITVDPALAFYFTDDEILTFSYTSGSDLTRKLQQTIKEMHLLEFDKQPIAITALFRILIELCCRKACDAFNMEFKEKNLGTVVKEVLTRLNNKLPEDKIINSKGLKTSKILLDGKKTAEIRNFLKSLDEEELKNVSKDVGEKSIIDILNLYIHRENEVTQDIIRYWHRMKPFLLACLQIPK